MKVITHPSDWVLHATWQDYRLSAAQPLYAMVSLHTKVAAPRIDLHGGMEIGIVLQGRQERRYPDWSAELTPGDVWLQPMWEPHAWRPLKAHTRSVVLMFRPEFLGEELLQGRSWLSPFAAPAPFRPWVREREQRKLTLAIGQGLAAEIEAKEQGWQTAVRLEALRLLFTLTRHWTPPAQATEASAARVVDLSRVMPAIALIQQRPAAATSLEEAARACGLSRSRFTALFRRTMGTSFAQFALRARLGSAAHRLLTTDQTVETIAHQSGFVDASHFHRTFVRHYGRTPAQYRTRER